MRVLGALMAVAVVLTALFACSDDKATNDADADQTLTGSYTGMYYYSQYIGGSQNKILSQAVSVTFDDTLFRMRGADGPPVFCDIAAPYTAGSTVTIDCPDLQTNCPEREHPCGTFTKEWKRDSLKLSSTTTEGQYYTNVRRLELKKND